MSAREAWRGLMVKLGVSEDTDTDLEQLVQLYEQAERHYHNLAHVLACLRELDGVRGLAERAELIELALWFHDAVYEPRGTANEMRSAAMVETFCTRRGIGHDVARRAGELVMATLHPTEARDVDGRLIADIDLAILGQPVGAYDAYERAIRAEYAWVPWERYCAGRRRVLEDLLSQASIYRTAAMRSRYEEKARGNLFRAIEALG